MALSNIIPHSIRTWKETQTGNPGRRYCHTGGCYRRCYLFGPDYTDRNRLEGKTSRTVLGFQTQGSGGTILF